MLLLVSAFLHCAWEWQATLQHLAVVRQVYAAGRPLPVGLPVPGCDNESGCICRGATVAQSVDASCLATGPSTWLAVDAPERAHPFDAVRRASSPAGWQEPDSPISGRQLRALIGSLLI